MGATTMEESDFKATVLASEGNKSVLEGHQISNVCLTFHKLPLGLACETFNTRTIVTVVEEIAKDVPHEIVGMEMYKVNAVDVTKLLWPSTVDVIKASDFPLIIEFRPIEHDGTHSPLPPSPKNK